MTILKAFGFCEALYSCDYYDAKHYCVLYFTSSRAYLIYFYSFHERSIIINFLLIFCRLKYPPTYSTRSSSYKND